MKLISKMAIIAASLIGFGANANAQAANPFGDNGVEYLLVGYSMFDFSLEADDQNVFGSGGRLCSYPVYFSMDAENGAFQVYNLVNLSVDIAQQPVKGVYEAAEGIMKIRTNPYFQSLDETGVIAASGNDYIVLQAGNPIGIGYWTDAEELVFNSFDDGKVLTPATGFAAFGYSYDEYWEDFNSVNLYDVMFNTHLYKRTEGVSILSSDYVLDAGECVLGDTRQVKFAIINSGTEESDFVIKAFGSGFSANVKSGFLEPLDYKEIIVSFSPDEVGEYEGKIRIQSEGEEIEIVLKGQGVSLPDYARIVTEGADKMVFSTSADYPWQVSDSIAEGPVAVSGNAGVDNSQSWLAIAIDIPQGEKGVLNWSGFFDPHYGTRDQFTVTDNGKEVFATPIKHEICDVEGIINLLAGKHEIVFTYAKDMSVFPQGVVFGSDRAWLKSLSLKVGEYLPQDASLRNPEVDFNRFYLVGKVVSHSVTGPVIVNEGYETLKIMDVKSSGVFFGEASKAELEPEECVDLTIGFRANEPGDYEGDVVFVTSAGEFAVHCHVLVEPSPDYSSIVRKGEFIFVPDNQYPFVVEDGKAYNSTSGVEDAEETLSVLTAVFNVPAGKYGKLTWDGKADTQANAWTADYGVLMVDNNGYNLHFYHGHDYAGHYTADPYEVYFTPGDHLISWGYFQCGDGVAYGADRLTISNLSLELMDKIPAMEVWEPTPIDMGTVFAGSMNVRTVQVANLTNSEMAFTESDSCAVFNLWFDPEINSEIPSMSTGTTEVYFNPVMPGYADADLSLQASGAKVDIPVRGYGIDTSNLAFYEDFEDGMAGWKAIDANKDKYHWESDVAGTYSRTGLGSVIIGTVFSDYTDDYLVSPEFDVPADSPTLEYWRRYTKSENNDYDVLIGEGDDPAYFDVAYTDEGHSQFEFEKVTVDLSAYAGRKACIAFHNRTSDGKQSVLIIDDVAVASKSVFSSLSVSKTSGEIVGREFFNLQGVRLAGRPAGMYIEKISYSDGNVDIIKRISK